MLIFQAGIISLFYSKVLLSSSTHGVNYEELVLDDGNAILPDTSLTANGEHLYVLTRANVSLFYKISWLKIFY